jgi:predicted dehydrogenase
MVRLGIIGLGNMGAVHARATAEIRDCQLVAVADSDTARLSAFPEVLQFADPEALIQSGSVDAVVLATPHFSHTTLGIAALQAGLHLLVEKPISVHKADCERLIAARGSETQVFAAMFNQRTDPHYQAIRKIVRDGELGDIVRTNWIITNWFRTDAYYASGGWRATWRGEGGGVLLNQCPHNLDLFQWICGMPSKVRAFCGFGKHHAIEVEDEVTAYFEYPNGASGVLVTSTGEAPGTNRLEICGDRGKLVLEGGTIRVQRTEVPVSEFRRTSLESFATPKTSASEIAPDNHGGQHKEILQNFVDSILHGTPLIAPAEEGLHSVELANAMLYSAWTDSTVTLPLDSRAYEDALSERIATSQERRDVRSDVRTDMNQSFA